MLVARGLELGWCRIIGDDPGLIVDYVFHREDVDDFPVRRDGNSFGRFDDLGDIIGSDFFICPCNVKRPVMIKCLEVMTSDADIS